MEKKNYLSKTILHSLSFLIIVLLTACSSGVMPDFNTNGIFTAPPPSSPHSDLWTDNPELTWQKLQHISSLHLKAMKSNDPQKNAWIQLALINKRNSLNTTKLVGELLAWRQQYPHHPANQLIPNNEILMQLITSSRPQHIALLLPLDGSYALPAQMVREGFLSAYYANSAKTNKQIVKFYDTHGANIIKLYQQALSEGADFIVGPLTKDHVQQLISGTSFSIPTLALNYTDGWLSPNFYEFGLLPEDETAQMATRAHFAGHSKALIIAPQNAWGKRVVSAFSKRWQELGGNIQDSLLYNSHTNLNQEISRLLHVDPLERDNNNAPQKGRQDFDVIFLFSPPQIARIIVPLLRYDYANNVAIFANSSVYSGTPSPAKDVDLNGVIMCDIPWRKSEGQNDRLYAVGRDAYLLSQTLPRLIQLPHFAFYGTTGALTLTSQHQIHRSIPCKAFQNGLI